MKTTEMIESILKINPSFSSKISALPDLMKSYLFQVKFEFHDSSLTPYEEDLMLRVKSIDVNDGTIEINFSEFQDALIAKLYHTPAFRKSKVDIIIEQYDSTLKYRICTFRYNNTTMFRGHERNMHFKLDVTGNEPVERKIVFLMSSDENDKIMPTV